MREAASLGAALRVAAGPYAHVHGVDGRIVFSPGERVACEQVAQSLRVYSSPVERGVEVTPAAAVRCFEAQVDRRRNGLCGEDGVGELEEGVCSAVEAFVERAAEVE